MEQPLYLLPSTWRWAKLGDVAHTTSGGTPKRSEKSYWGGEIPWIKSGELGDSIVQENGEFITEVGLSKSSAKIFPAGSLLIALYGATAGKLGVLSYDAATNQAVCCIRPLGDELIRDYARYYLLRKRGQIIEDSFGGAQPNISQGYLRELQIPLPPLDEQKRIVAKLDALFTRIDAAITHLQETLELSKALFASALETAFVPTGDFYRPPATWKVDDLDSVSERITDGTHHSPKEQFDSEGPGRYKYLTSKHVKFDGLRLENVTYINKKVHDEIYSRCNPEYLDQLITKDGAMTGTCCLNNLEEPFSLLSSVALVKLKRELVIPYFLNYFLRSPVGQELMLGDISGAAITRTNLKKLKALKVPVPPIEDQERIVTHLDALAEHTRTLEAETQERLDQLATLKSSLLDSAFRGQL